MSRETVRAAIVGYLQPPAVDGLNLFFTAQPRNMADHVYTEGQPPGTTGAAAGWLTLPNHTEEAQAFDGAGGGRLTTYTATLVFHHLSIEEQAEDAAAQVDTFVELLLNRLRSDPTLGVGTDTNLLSAAYRSLTVEVGDPSSANEDGTGQIETWVTVTFPVEEWNQIT